MTSEVKHTPGPWTAGWSKYRENTFVVKAGMPSNRVLAQFDGDGDAEGPDEQSKADARLIAAAPELLDTARRAVAMIELLHAKAYQIGLEGSKDWDELVVGSDVQGTHDILSHAISKATA